MEGSAATGNSRPPALLLLGPTGSGKTPLGERLQARGVRGRRCAHFDFGACLRQVQADNGAAFGLAPHATAVVRDALASGRLLEDSEFFVAEQILAGFLAGPGRAVDCIVLNGLPRHVGQAEAMARLVSVETVAVLDASESVVRQRLVTNAGGDRSGRDDDGEPLVREKLKLFQARTVPLIAYYRARSAEVVTVAVDVDTVPDAIITELEAS